MYIIYVYVQDDDVTQWSMEYVYIRIKFTRYNHIFIIIAALEIVPSWTENTYVRKAWLYLK